MRIIRSRRWRDVPANLCLSLLANVVILVFSIHRAELSWRAWFGLRD